MHQKEIIETKIKMFNSLDNLTIIVPSEWMEGIVKESFMSRYPVEVVNNGINLGKFVYREPLDRLYEKYGIGRDKKIILGVASIWDARKGMEDFLSLANILSDEYQIVLVGLSKRQMCKLPDNVIGFCGLRIRKNWSCYILFPMFL